MSKLSTLKQEAYKAGKKRNWAQAIMLYEQILELEKNNPTIINELGDLCLKGDEPQRAVRYFLSAASKYRSNGLLNNAVAIYKKILRHDAENLNAHWYLSETRANQGLVVEGENHAVHFLDSSEEVSGDIKEIFLKRCQSLFDLYPESRVILSRLSQIFRLWTMPLESARADCLLLCMDFAGGQENDARQAMDELTGKTPDVMNYPEFGKWNQLANPTAVDKGAFSDFGSVDLGADQKAPETPGPAAEVPSAPTAGGFDDLVLGGDTPPAAPAAASDPGPAPDPEPAPTAPQTTINPLLDAVQSATAPAGADTDDDGCFSIDDEPAPSGFDDLIAAATGDLKSDSPAEEVFSEPGPATGSAATGADKVDLLAEMLGEEGPDLTATSSGELATISAEIGSVVGGGEDADAAQLYEMGTVYLEMGMLDQACESFETAAADEEYCIRAHEMWGVALQKANRFPEAITVLTSGLDYAEEGTREHHGLMYHLGIAMEKSGQSDKAIVCFKAINDVQPGYLDVGRRLAKLTAV